jgi:hypothetical protein
MRSGQLPRYNAITIPPMRHFRNGGKHGSPFPRIIAERDRLREFLDVAIGQENDEAAQEDAEDIADAKAALAEPGFLSIAEFKQELGRS